jgi:hypothetical protein
MSDPCSPAIILEKVQGGSKGLIINSETLRILRQLMSIPLQTIENECRKDRYRPRYDEDGNELWSMDGHSYSTILQRPCDKSPHIILLHSKHK